MALKYNIISFIMILSRLVVYVIFFFRYMNALIIKYSVV